MRMTVEREGSKASQGTVKNTFFVLLLAENTRERDQVAAKPTRTLASLIV